jgi:ribonuclease HI
MKLEIYADGSGQTKDGPGGYGWVIVVDGVFLEEGSGRLEKATNNDCEMEAAIQGLQNALSVYWDQFKKSELFNPEVVLISDSKICLGWADGSFNFTQVHKLDKYRLLRHLMQKMSATTRWVKGHNGDQWNERCDKVAKSARLLQDPPPLKAKAETKSLIGNRKSGVVCLWYQDQLKIVDLEQNLVENYDIDTHEPRATAIEVRKVK